MGGKRVAGSAAKAATGDVGSQGTGKGRPKGRRFGSGLFVWIVLGVATLGVAGVAGAVVISRTAAGRELALDWVLGRLAPAINGSVTVGAVGPGGLLGGATLHDIQIRDSSGHPVLVVDSARARYSIAQLLGAAPGLAELHLWSPALDLAPAAGGRIYLDSLLVSAGSTAGAAASPGAAAQPDGAAPPGAPTSEDRETFLVRDAWIHGGTMVVRDDAGDRKHVRGIEAKLPRIEMRTDPEARVLIEVEDLDFSYPLGLGWLEVHGIEGAIDADEHAVSVEVEHFGLPSSEGRGGVDIVWGTEDWSAVFDLDMEHLALADLDWIDQRFDHGSARGGIRIESSPSEVRIEFIETEAEAGAARMGFSGAFTVNDSVRFEGLSVAPNRLSTRELNRWMPTPSPVSGLLSGQLRFDGNPGRLSTAGDLVLLSEDGGEVVARLSGRGTVHGTGALEDFSVSATQLDYELLRVLAPGVPWRGGGDLTIRLDGDLDTGIAVELAANQSLADGEVSSVAVAGTVYGDTAISVVDLHIRAEPLSLTTLGELYPGFPLTGEVSGVMSLSGPLHELGFDAELQTAAGPLTTEGQFNARDLAAGYRIAASVEDFRLSELFAELPDPVILTAAATLNGRGLDLESVRGGLVLEAGPSTVGLLEVDSAGVQAWVDDDGILRIESVHADAGGVVVRGQGSLGTVSEAGEGVTLAFASPSVHPLRDLFMGQNLVAWDELLPIEQSIMIEVDGVDPDTFPRARDIRFDGRLDGRARVTGTIEDLLAVASVSFANLEYGQVSAGALQADFTVDGLGLPALGPAASEAPDSAGASAQREPISLDGTVTADSVAFRDRQYRSALLEGSFAVGSGGRLRAFVSRSGNESYEAQGVFRLTERGGRIDLDRLTMVNDDRRWNLRGPARFDWDPDAVVVSDFGLIRPGTEGLRVRANGRLARGEGESDFELEIADLDLEVFGRLLQMGAPPTGVVMANLKASGPGSAPRWTGMLQISDVEYQTLSFDRVTANGSYADQALLTRIEAWGERQRNLLVSGTIPMDLRLASVPARFPDEPLDLRITADSFPAAMVLGGLQALEDIEGTVSGNVLLKGRPSAPEPDGLVYLEDVAASLAAFGIRLSSAEMNLDLDPSGVVAIAGSAVSGGTVDFRGTVDAGRITDDVALDLAFWPRELQIVDRLDIEAAVSGDSVALTGTFNYPLIEGALDVNGGTVFIEEFQRAAETVDFYDPALFSAATMQLGSGAGSSGGVTERNPFVQNLRLLVDLRAGRGNWLRGRQMDVETEGDLSLTFDRAGNQFIIQGDMDVVRGTYSLGPRTLHIREGVFRFPGTPGFDPGISVTAVTRLRTCEGEPGEVTTTISGTLALPYVNVWSDAESATSESELFNLLVLNRCSSNLLSAGGAASVGATSLLLNQVYNEFGSVLGQQVGVDFLSVSRAQLGQATTALGGSSLQVEAGKYIWPNVFLTGVYQRGFCADPTLPVSSGGMRVEVEMPRDLTLEGFLESRCTRERYRGLGDISLELERVWGFSLFREWGYR